jgi:hypothetical protein
VQVEIRGIPSISRTLRNGWGREQITKKGEPMILSNFFAGFDWKNGVELIGAAVALGTLIKGTVEYIKQGTLKRAELFFQMEERYSKFLYLFDMLDHQDDEKIRKQLESLSFEKKLDFLGFYEQLAMMVESGLIRRKVAHYMYGYYAIACLDSDVFWNEENRNDPYWYLFRNFAEQSKLYMSALRRKFKPKEYKL